MCGVGISNWYSPNSDTIQYSRDAMTYQEWQERKQDMGSQFVGGTTGNLGAAIPTNKFWTLFPGGGHGGNGETFESYDAAEAEAKRRTERHDSVWAIMEAVSFTKKPVPPIEVTKFG